MIIVLVIGFWINISLAQNFDINSFCDNKCSTQWCSETECSSQENSCKTDCLNSYNKCKSENGAEFCECKINGWIVLNNNFPFIGRCIKKDGNTADGKNSSLVAISSAFSNIFMTLILTGGFAMVIRGGVQIAMGQNKEGMAKIRNVVIAFAALGSLGIILRLINPNFFK